MGRCHSGLCWPRCRPGGWAPGRRVVGDELLRARLGLCQRAGKVGAGRQVDGQRRARLPVAGNLQHRRAREAAVGEQQVFQEGGAGLLRACRDFHRQRQAGQLRVRRPGVAVEGERHQARPALHQRNAELLRQPVAEVRRSDLGDGQAARGDDQAARLHRAAVGIDLIAACAGFIRASGRRSYFPDAAGLPALDLADLAFGQQHADDVLGRTVGEELALVLFVWGTPCRSSKAMKSAGV